MITSVWGMQPSRQLSRPRLLTSTSNNRKLDVDHRCAIHCPSIAYGLRFPVHVVALLPSLFQNWTTLPTHRKQNNKLTRQSIRWSMASALFLGSWAVMMGPMVYGTSAPHPQTTHTSTSKLRDTHTHIGCASITPQNS